MKLFAVIYSFIVLIIVYFQLGFEVLVPKSLELGGALIFILFSNFIANNMSGTFLGFLSFGHASGLGEERHYRALGWFVLIFLPIVWYFIPDLI